MDDAALMLAIKHNLAKIGINITDEQLSIIKKELWSDLYDFYMDGYGEGVSDANERMD